MHKKGRNRTIPAAVIPTTYITFFLKLQPDTCIASGIRRATNGIIKHSEQPLTVNQQRKSF